MDKIKQRIEEIITKLGYYLYDVEYVTENNEKVLRVMVENDTHITLDDCVVVSEHLNNAFDQDDPFDEPYNLEVTSAGAEHELHTSEQIERAVGETVYVETYDQKITGTLVRYKDTLLIPNNESKADLEKYGQYYENGKKTR